MRGLKTFRSARILCYRARVCPDLRRGHFDVATDAPAHNRLTRAFNGLALAI